MTPTGSKWWSLDRAAESWGAAVDHRVEWRDRRPIIDLLNRSLDTVIPLPIVRAMANILEEP